MYKPKVGVQDVLVEMEQGTTNTNVSKSDTLAHKVGSG